MSIPTAIKEQLADLVTAFDAASPIDTKATRGEILGLRQRCRDLIAAIDAAVPVAGQPLDDTTQPAMPDDMAAQILARRAAARDQLSLVEMRGLIGRALANLNLAQGA